MDYDAHRQRHLDNDLVEAWHNLWTAHLNLEGRGPGSQFYIDNLTKLQTALGAYTLLVEELSQRAGVQDQR